MTRDELKKLRVFEKRLGYAFKRREHLRRALLHRSYANEQRLPATEHNERYEFLGDAVLSLATSHLLMHAFPEATEGELSKLRAAIVNEQQLAELARRMGLGDELYLGRGEEQTGGRDKPSLLADGFEAVLGAIYSDRGFAKAFAAVERFYKPILAQVREGTFIRDFKTKLQEEAQGRFRQIPRYRLVRESGPDHSKVFEVQLFLNEECYGSGEAPSKKAAEQLAAKAALEKMGAL